MLHKVLLLSSVILLSACSANQQSLKFAANNFERHNYTRSLQYLEQPARAGDREAQYAIGYMYFYGKGVVENRAEAIKWFQLAAAKGQPDAISALKTIHKSERKNRYS